MATLYLAHDIKHNRKVAVKVLRPELAAILGAERFLKEIEVTANLHDAFERGDLAAVVDLLGDDIGWKFQGPQEIPYTGAFRGRENVKKFFEAVGEHVEGEAFNVHDFIASGDRVAVLGDERMRVKATGLAFEMEWADVFTLRDGKIVRFRSMRIRGQC